MKAGLQSNITEKDKFIKVIFLEVKGRDLFANILKNGVAHKIDFLAPSKLREHVNINSWSLLLAQPTLLVFKDK